MTPPAVALAVKLNLF